MKDIDKRLEALERQHSEQGEPIQLNLDALTPEARADVLAHWSEQDGPDIKGMKSETLHALLEQCDAATGQPAA